MIHSSGGLWCCKETKLIESECVAVGRTYRTAVSYVHTGIIYSVVPKISRDPPPPPGLTFIRIKPHLLFATTKTWQSYIHCCAGELPVLYTSADSVCIYDRCFDFPLCREFKSRHNLSALLEASLVSVGVGWAFLL